MWYFLAILALIVILIVRSKRFVTPSGDGFALSVGKLTKEVVGWGIPLMLLATISSWIVIVPAGHRGIVFSSITGVQSIPLDEGLNFVVPIINKVTMMEVRVVKREFKATAASKDLQDVSTAIALNFYPLPDAVAKIFQHIGVNFEERIIQPLVQEVVKATTARYTAEELITKREQVKNEIQETLTSALQKSDLFVQGIFITDFNFSAAFNKAIDEKQVAEQNAQKALRDLQRIKIEAEQKIVTARAEAKALEMQRAAISPDLILLRAVEAFKATWDGKLPLVVMGGGQGDGGTPLFDMTEIMKMRPQSVVAQSDQKAKQ